jgi:cobalt-zinc-cadmium efflux system membrane fusion protein
MNTTRTLPALALAAAALALAGCGSGASDSAEKMTSYSTRQAVKAELFTVPAEQMSHVKVAAVETTPLGRTLRLTGQVAYNGFRTTPVISAVGGPVSRVLVAPGEHVQKGQSLLEVSSPDYSQLRASYLKAREAYHVTDKNYARAQDLYAHSAIAERDLLQAESDRNQAKADLDASEQVLRILGVPRPDALEKAPPSPELPLLAPFAGEVVERLCSPGQLLQAGGTQCFTISDMSSVWVLVNIYQNQLAYVHPGDTVEVQTDAYPTVFHGRISYVAPALDPNTRTLQARIVTENPGEKLKKDMWVTALVQAGKIENTLTVPDSAVLRDTENLPFVYVLVGENQFGRRSVTIGGTQGGRIEILSGLKAGERVAGDGSLFLQFKNSLQQ